MISTYKLLLPLLPSSPEVTTCRTLSRLGCTGSSEFLQTPTMLGRVFFSLAPRIATRSSSVFLAHPGRPGGRTIPSVLLHSHKKYSCYSSFLARSAPRRVVPPTKTRHRCFSSSKNNKPGDPTSGTTQQQQQQQTWLQKFLAPKPMPERNTAAWYREILLICTVFGITGSSTMLVRDCTALLEIPES